MGSGVGAADGPAVTSTTATVVATVGAPDGAACGEFVEAEDAASKTSAQQRKLLVEVLFRQNVSVPPKLVEPYATRLPPAHVVLLQSRSSSRLQPVPRVSSLRSSSDVHKRAPRFSHESLATLQVAIPLQEPPAPPRPSSLAEHTVESPRAAALVQPSWSHDEEERRPSALLDEETEGDCEGAAVGADEGGLVVTSTMATVGAPDGAPDGPTDGSTVGSADGSTVGSADGC